MIDYTAASDVLFGLVGFRQNQDPNGLQLSSALIGSTSGLRYDVHPMITLDNLIAISPDFVRKFPTESQQHTKFNEWLEAVVRGLLADLAASWWSKKARKNTARTLVDSRDAYSFEYATTFGSPPSGKRLGVRVTPFGEDSPLLTSNVLEVGIRLSAPQSLDIHFQAFDSTEPDYSVTVEYTGHGEQEWFTVQYNQNLAGGMGFYVYYESDDVQNSIALHRGECNCRNSWRNITVTGMTEDSSANPYEMNPAVTRENYGLNLRLTLTCDYTILISDQKDMFAPLVSYYVASELLRMMAMNPNARLNRNEGMVNPDLLLNEIDGDPRGRKTGFAMRLHDAWSSVQFAREDFDPICLPCDSYGGISRVQTG